LRLCYANNKFKQDKISINDLKESVAVIKSDYDRTGSHSLKLHYHMLQGILYDRDNEIIRARDNYLELYQYILSKPTYYSDTELYLSLINIVNCETLLFNFESSLNYLRAITGKTSKMLFNKKMVSELEFINNFYLGNWKKCYALKEVLLEKSSYSKIPAYIGEKRLFYFSCLEFINGRFKEALQLLNQCVNLDKDKTGWNIGLRLLMIMVSIETDKLNLAESQIENLRKHLSRFDVLDLNPRINIILKILIALERNSFNFVSTIKQCTNYFNLLKGKDRKYRSNLLTPELIPFHEWFNFRSKGLPYSQLEVIDRLKKIQSYN
jgi:hypothetical protein